MLRTISTKGLRKIEGLWMSDWHANVDRYAGGNTERWFNIVLDFLNLGAMKSSPEAFASKKSASST